MKKGLAFFFIACFFIMSSYSQRKEMYKAFEDSIVKLHKEILLEQNTIIKYQKTNNCFFDGRSLAAKIRLIMLSTH